MILDEAALAFVRTCQPKALPHLAERTATEVATASAVFDEHGWSADPAIYHRRPQPLTAHDVTTIAYRAWPRRHESAVFASGFEPRSIEPAAHRWRRGTRNDTVHVRLLRHRTAARPWVVCVHGFGMGASRFDLALLWANHFHSTLGFNVAVPVLPFHGARRSPGSDRLLSLDLAMTLHGITQAIWDIRRLVHWIRLIGGEAVGVYGLSLGGYLAALLAGIEPVDCVVAGIPFIDVLALMAHHRAPVEYADILHSEAAKNAFRVVSPLALSPQVAPSRLASFAGQSDRLIPPEHHAAFAQVWPHSPVHHYPAGHTGYLRSRQTKAFVTDFLRSALT
jgi:pimeloyl-ACP methyl ester carboxylesterase